LSEQVIGAHRRKITKALVRSSAHLAAPVEHRRTPRASAQNHKSPGQIIGAFIGVIGAPEHRRTLCPLKGTGWPAPAKRPATKVLQWRKRPSTDADYIARGLSPDCHRLTATAAPPAPASRAWYVDRRFLATHAGRTDTAGGIARTLLAGLAIPDPTDPDTRAALVELRAAHHEAAAVPTKDERQP
jgi:hypothetical protein